MPIYIDLSIDVSIYLYDDPHPDRIQNRQIHQKDQIHQNHQNHQNHQKYLLCIHCGVEPSLLLSSSEHNLCHKVMVPGSNLFCVGHLDRGALRQDAWYSWRWPGEKTARKKRIIFKKILIFLILIHFRPGIYRNMWKLDKEGNMTKTCQGLAHCANCEDVKKVVDTVSMKRVSCMPYCLPNCSEGTRCALCFYIRK